MGDLNAPSNSEILFFSKMIETKIVQILSAKALLLLS